jgi:hypothetical protein
MSLRNRIVLPLVLLSLAVLGACGGNGGNNFTNPNPPPSGSFSNSNLNGTYVFSVGGIDSQGAPYALAGTFTADGNGGISGGAVDVNDADLSAPVPNSALTSSSYKVSVDGRGQATLNISSLGAVTLDFVLQDSSHGLVMESDTNATGSGSLDLQTAGVSPAGTYAFSMAGFEYVSFVTANPFATVGNFTVGSGGAITGTEDFNDNQFAFTNQALTGSVVLGPSSTPSTTLSTSFSSNNLGLPSLTFDVIPISATHLKFVEMDAGANLIGDAFAQTSTTLPTGNLAFTLAGTFPTTSGFSAAGGFLVTDGAGNITSASTADANNSGSVSPGPIGFSGSYTAAGTGRYTLSLSSFTDGIAYVAYPFTGGVFLLETDNSGSMSGAAYPQTDQTLAASEGYALNFTGANLSAGVEVDDIAEFQTDSAAANVTGVVDENFQPGGGPTLGLALSGTSTTPDSNGRGQLAANAGNNSVSTLNGGFGLTYYAVDGTTFPFIETDANGQVTMGAFLKQDATASSAQLAHPHLYVRSLIRSSKAWRKKK